MVTAYKVDLSELFPEKQDIFAYIIDGLFTERECKNYIAMTEKLGYKEALVGNNQVRNVENRNNYRCMLDSEEIAATLFQRLKPYLPQTWLGANLDSVNPRLRFLRYNKNEYFKPHHDGIYITPDEKKCSYITIHLYLNEDYKGGETTFLTHGKNYGTLDDSNIENEPERLSIIPKIGRVLIFEHHLLHEGSELISGTKYTVRTDVMYATETPVLLQRWRTNIPHPHYKSTK